MYYINGSYVRDEEAAISVLDLGLIRGYGVFDFLRTYHGRTFHLWDHLLRLKYSADAIGLSLPNDLKEIAAIVETLVEKNGYPESCVKIVVTGGVSPDQIIPQGNSALIILVYPLKPYPADFYTSGIKVVSTSLPRSMPLAKTIQYLPGIVALQQGRRENAQEAIYLNSKGEILEAITCNFFAFKEDRLITPASEEILFGITREVVLNIAAPSFPIEIRSIPYAEIKELSEAFITSSAREVMPVTVIDNQKIGDGKVGPHTKKVMELFNEYTRQAEWPDLLINRYSLNNSVEKYRSILSAKTVTI